LVCVGELRIKRVLARGIEEQSRGVIRILQRSLLECSNKNLSNAGERAALGLHPDVNPRADEEEGAGEEHEDSGDGEAEGPADVSLDVYDDSGGEHHGEGEGEVVPVEEAVDSLSA